MINILFISDTPQAEQLRNYFQPRFQARFIVVADYDHGLKDVFEKRPTVVFIQEQISGVTGESVAKHIQLLLGDSSPAFVLVHDSSSKAKPCQGLFNHLLNISLAPEEMCQGFDNIMRDLAKGKWTPLSAEQEKSPIEETKQPVDADIIPDLPIEPPAPSESPEHTALDDIFPASSHVEPAISQPVSAPVSNASSEQDQKQQLLNTFDDFQQQNKRHEKPPKTVEPLRGMDPPMPPPLKQQVGGQRPRKKVRPGASAKNEEKKAELLESFESNHKKSGNTLTHWILLGSLVAAACFAALSLYLVWSSSVAPSKVSKVAVQKAPKPLPDPDVTPSEKDPSLQEVDTVQPLPSFIPLAGLDQGFSKTSPGWSRYLGKGRDYRVYRTDGSIKALQVIATSSTPIAPGELQAAMKELFGVTTYNVHSRKESGGLLLERATLEDVGELLAYRTQAGGPLRAFVLTAN